MGRLLGRPSDRRRLVAFLGGTIGNFTPEKRGGFLKALRAGLREGDRVLIGLDLVKDTRTLEAAYNDAAGVTARFNRNMIRVINRRLGAGLDPDLFSHRAVYNAAEGASSYWTSTPNPRTASPWLSGEGRRSHRLSGVSGQLPF